MLDCIAGRSGTGKSAGVLAYARRPVLLLTPDQDRAVLLRAQLRAEDRVKIAKVKHLDQLLSRLRKLAPKHDGLVVVDEFKALANATLVRYTEHQGAQAAEQVSRSVWFALRRTIVAVLAELAALDSVMLTQHDEDVNGMLAPAGGSRATSQLIREASNNLVPLVTAQQRLAWLADEGFDVDLPTLGADGADADAGADPDDLPPHPDDDPKKGKTDKKGGKKSDGKRGKKTGDGKKGPRKSKRQPRKAPMLARSTDMLAQRVAALGVDWPIVPRWGVIADMTGEFAHACSTFGHASVLPPYLPLLLPDSMTARRDDDALHALHEIRAGRLSIAASGYSRVYLAIQGQIEAWGGYASTDYI